MNIIKQSATLEFCTPDALQLIERAGRTCYKSEERITETSAIDFIKMLKHVEHESVMEHASATIRFITDRGVTHEIVRHRIASYSQESTRYCNYCKDKFGNEVTFILPVWFDLSVEELSVARKGDQQLHLWMKACEESEQSYFALLKAGQTPQQARDVLNHSLKTELVMTANFREWLHFFELRTSEKAHPQIRALAAEARELLRKEVPILFD